jgi:ABC-2 type transport system permease protein
VDPFTAGLRYLGNLIINGHSPGQDAGWLIGPVVAAVVAVAVALAVANRLTLHGGDQA